MDTRRAEIGSWVGVMALALFGCGRADEHAYVIAEVVDASSQAEDRALGKQVQIFAKGPKSSTPATLRVATSSGTFDLRQQSGLTSACVALSTDDNASDDTIVWVHPSGAEAVLTAQLLMGRPTSDTALACDGLSLSSALDEASVVVRGSGAGADDASSSSASSSSASASSSTGGAI